MLKLIKDVEKIGHPIVGKYIFTDDKFPFGGDSFQITNCLNKS